MISKFRSLFPLVRKYKNWYFGGIFFLIIANAGQLIIPQFIREAIDSFGNADKFANIPHLVIYIVLISLGIALGRIAWRLCIQGAARRIENELREKLFAHWLTLGRSYYAKQKVGDLMALATNDLTSVRMSISMALVAAFDGIFMTISILSILIATQGITALGFLIPLPLITLIILFMGRMTGPLFKEQQASFGVLSRQAQEVYSGLKLIQSMVKEKYFVERFKDASKNYQRKTIKQVTISGIMFPIVGFLSGLTLTLLIIFGGQAVIDGKMTTGTLISDITYLQLLIWPMLGAGFTVNLLERGAASLGRVNEVFASQNDIITDMPQPIEKNIGNIQFRNLMFTYPSAKIPVLKNFSLIIPEGSWLGVTGPIGSGKSTLWQVMLRLYPVDKAQVFYGVHDLVQTEPDELRAKIGIVPQEHFLFSDSIINNVKFGARSEGQNENDVLRVLEDAHFTRDLSIFTDGLETEVGERGVTLSGGQKQRLSLARALFRDPEILILDDSLASVDAETERSILDNLKRLRQGKTTIIISNKISALIPCDHIIVLDKGQISQEGSHNDLILEHGYYQDVYKLQSEQGKI